MSLSLRRSQRHLAVLCTQWLLSEWVFFLGKRRGEKRGQRRKRSKTWRVRRDGEKGNEMREKERQEGRILPLFICLSVHLSPAQGSSPWTSVHRITQVICGKCRFLPPLSNILIQQGSCPQSFLMRVAFWCSFEKHCPRKGMITAAVKEGSSSGIDTP